MNAKKAKALRRMLRDSIKNSGKEVQDVAYVEVEKNRKYGLTNDTSGAQHIKIADGTHIVTNTSVRGAYLALKKGFNNCTPEQQAELK
jgi:hypothetical protein